MYPVRRFVYLLLFLLVALPAAAAGPSGIDLTDPDAVSSVLTPCFLGTPAIVDFRTDTPGNSTERREHVEISSGLATAIGLDPADVDPGGENSPQIRVAVNSQKIEGLTSSANFTVDNVYTESIRELRVYQRTSPGDKNSGDYKLFASESVNFDDIRLGVYPVAPHTTWIEEPTFTRAISSYCRPEYQGSHYFMERTRPRADKRFILAIPHGGAIETGTSDQIDPLVDVLDQSYSIDANVWENEGYWGDGQTFVRWHITSDAFHGPSFPGLNEILDDTDFVTGRPFQYAAALHGFGSSAKSIVVGGDSDLDEKCYVVDRVLNRLGSRAGEVAFYIFDSSDLAANDVIVADSTGRRLLRDDVDHLRGLDNDNIVNRLSPNPSAQPGFGAFQLEQSKALRDDATLRDAVARGVADAVGDLIGSGLPSGFSCNSL